MSAEGLGSITLYLLIGTKLFAKEKMSCHLGNHKATSALNMNVKGIINVADVLVGQSTFAASNAIFDINSSNKATVIPRQNNITSLNVAGNHKRYDSLLKINS